MYRDSFPAQIVNSKDAADYVPAKIVEDKHLPHRFPILVEEGINLVLCSCCVLTSTIACRNVVVET